MKQLQLSIIESQHILDSLFYRVENLQSKRISLKINLEKTFDDVDIKCIYAKIQSIQSECRQLITIIDRITKYQNSLVKGTIE